MKRYLTGLLIGLVACLSPALADVWPKQVTDILGNKVTIEQPPQRILLASGFNLLALSFVEPDPVSRLAAWGSDLKRFDSETYGLFQQRFPALATLPTVGSGSGDELSSEMILAVQPDLVIFDAWQAAGSASLADKLKKVGIPVIYIDFYQSPLHNTIPSTRLLGQVMGREAQAEELISFYSAHMERLTSRIAGQQLKQRRVLLHAYPGVWNCCWSSGSGGIGEFITLFGGENIGAAQFPNANGGQLNLEYIITADPEIYIATGHSGVNQKTALPIGTAIDSALSRRQLNYVVSAPGLNTTSAVREQRIYGFWNYFSGSPFNIVGAELMAKWLQPELYQDIDPQQTMDEINRRFLPVTLTGTYWVNGK